MVTSWLRRDAHGAKTAKALEPRNVLVVLSGHAMDEDLVRMACTLAKNGKGHVIAINVVEVPRSLPLAARCLAKGAVVLSAKGEAIGEERIGMALALRDLSRHLREVTGRETHHAAFGKRDRSRFLDALENAIQAIRRRSLR